VLADRVGDGLVEDGEDAVAPSARRKVRLVRADALADADLVVEELLGGVGRGEGEEDGEVRDLFRGEGESALAQGG